MISTLPRFSATSTLFGSSGCDLTDIPADDKQKVISFSKFVEVFQNLQVKSSLTEANKSPSHTQAMSLT